MRAADQGRRHGKRVDHSFVGARPTPPRSRTATSHTVKARLQCTSVKVPTLPSTSLPSFVPHDRATPKRRREKSTLPLHLDQTSLPSLPTSQPPIHSTGKRCSSCGNPPALAPPPLPRGSCGFSKIRWPRGRPNPAIGRTPGAATPCTRTNLEYMVPEMGREFSRWGRRRRQSRPWREQQQSWRSFWWSEKTRKKLISENKLPGWRRIFKTAKYPLRKETI